MHLMEQSDPINSTSQLPRSPIARMHLKLVSKSNDRRLLVFRYGPSQNHNQANLRWAVK